MALAISTSATAIEKECADHLMLAGGVFNIVKKPHRTLQIQFEYRWDVNFYHVRPLVSTMFTPTGAFYLCTGAGLDIYLGKRVVVTPSFAPGLYLRGDEGKNLHYPLEFRSAIEMAYESKSKMRFGAQFYHISNASLGQKNPGSESLIFFLALPLKGRFSS
jgi:lipid A 3-O-deacylase